MLEVLSEENTTEVIVADRPDLLEPSVTQNRIVVLPGRCLVNLITTNPAKPQPEMPVMNGLSRQLLGEVKEECENDLCSAYIANYIEDITEIKGRLLAVGVVCVNANASCPIACPDGIRDTL